MNTSRLEELTQKYVLGNLSKAERDELAIELSGDESKSARDHFRLALKTDAYLQDAAAEMEGGHFAVTSSKILSFERSLWAIGGIAAAIAVGLITWTQAPAPAATGVATIHRTEGQAYSTASEMLVAGDFLQKDDQLTVTEGLVELVFEDTGVHAVASAPLKMTLNSSERVFLHEGDLKLSVPPQGIGFIVETEEREITDLGTSFVVTANKEHSRVLVLDGLVSIGQKDNPGQQFMVEGEAATFGERGDKALLKKKVSKMPELPQPKASLSELSGLTSNLYAFTSSEFPSPKEQQDLIGQRFLPLARSGFRDKASLRGLRSEPVPPFTCIAGAYNDFGEKAGLDPDTVTRSGWIAWNQGKLQPPEPGRYRFVGYADNHLLVSINGKLAFEGGRYDSAFRESEIVERDNFPAWPCLNSVAGFAAGPWFEVGTDPIKFDLLFGEKRGNLTYALLLIEREGETYEETYWGQPKWPIFLTAVPNTPQREALKKLQEFLDEKLLGGFSLKEEAIWQIVP
ncbi:MAG: FecR domain-containing protein [Verrucomicrobiales bacterium]|nr:FecR domain-containing protein [Verrucomicrobiales bacterium]